MRSPISWGSFARNEPFSREWGIDRGGAVDRHYIQAFLADNANSIRGRVLEVANARYTREFGHGVERSDVLNVVAGDPATTIVADLASGEAIPSDAFDCVICTQTLQLIYDVRAAIRTLHRILRPGGVLLLTVPGISQISRQDMDRWGDYWRFRKDSVHQLFGEEFGSDELHVEAVGNALSTTAFLYGVSHRELTASDLAKRDPDCEMLICVRARKS